MTAVAKGNKELYDMFVQHGASLDVLDWEGFNLLHLAIINDEVEIIESLVKLGMDPNVLTAPPEDSFEYPETSLNLAAQHGHTSVIKTLLMNGVDINSENDFGYTALHRSAEHKNNKLILFLIENGARVDNPTKCGKTALHIAVDRLNATAVELLLKSGANPNCKFFSFTVETSALHTVFKQPNFDMKIVEMLMNYVSDINMKDSLGNTPFYYLIERCQGLLEHDEENIIVSKMLEMGASPLELDISLYMYFRARIVPKLKKELQDEIEKKELIGKILGIVLFNK